MLTEKENLPLVGFNPAASCQQHKEKAYAYVQCTFPTCYAVFHDWPNSPLKVSRFACGLSPLPYQSPETLLCADIRPGLPGLAFPTIIQYLGGL